MQNKFRRVSYEQLTRWKEQSGRNRIEKLSYISKFIHNKFTAAVESEFMVHDIDLKRWIL